MRKPSGASVYYFTTPATLKRQCMYTLNAFLKKGISFQQPPFQNGLTTVGHCHLDKTKELQSNSAHYATIFAFTIKYPSLLWWLYIWTMDINTLFLQKQIIPRLQVYLLVWIFRVYNHLSMEGSMDKPYFQWNHPSQSLCKTPSHSVYP